MGDCPSFLLSRRVETRGELSSTSGRWASASGVVPGPGPGATGELEAGVRYQKHLRSRPIWVKPVPPCRSSWFGGFGVF